MTKKYIIESKKIIKCESEDYTFNNTLEKECRVSTFDCERNNVDPTDPTTIPKFVDELPVPEVAEPIIFCDKKERSKKPFYYISMREGKHRFHKKFPLTTIWGYNGTYPGPTIEVEKDVPIEVNG